MNISTIRNIIGYSAMILIAIVLLSVPFIDGVDLLSPASYAMEIAPIELSPKRVPVDFVAQMSK